MSLVMMTRPSVICLNPSKRFRLDSNTSNYSSSPINYSYNYDRYSPVSYEEIRFNKGPTSPYYYYDGSSSVSSSPDSPGSSQDLEDLSSHLPQQHGNSKPVKICSVCGDVARSYNFGALCCDSCKVFFRRAVCKDGYLNFTCGHEETFLINKRSRRFCQKCRFEKCLNVGMERKWVLTEDERKELHRQRIERKRKRFEESSTPTYIPPPPSPEDLGTYMTPEEQHMVQDISDYYNHSCENIPYKVNVHKGKLDHTPSDVMGMFTTLLSRITYFCDMIPEFRALPREVQPHLLKSRVLEMVMLRGAFTFDMIQFSWPNHKASNPCPNLCIQDVQDLMPPDLLEMYLNFTKRIQYLKTDEYATFLLMLIVLFSPEERMDTSIRTLEAIGAAQEKYSDLLRKYMNWRYGVEEARRVYPKMLAELPNLRELNDRHTPSFLRLMDY